MTAHTQINQWIFEFGPMPPEHGGWQVSQGNLAMDGIIQENVFREIDGDG